MPMDLSEADRWRLVEAMAATIAEHAGELTDLDAAIGDGDHGHNMKRGFEAILAERAKIEGKPFGEALKTIGMTLVMKVGGASGPLYGTFFMEMGKALPSEPVAADWIAAYDKAVAGVMARGKASAGQKTMLDVLVPVGEALARGASVREVAEVAATRADATVPMLATKGRASFLGERSIGHMDPGARSSSLLIAAVANVLEA